MADLFELQVEELLKDLEKQADANLVKATNLLKQLKDAIDGLKNPRPENVVNPFPPPKDVQYTLEYAEPAAINVIGSTASKTLLAKNGETTADMVVVMPRSLFQEKDYKKHRYFHKKAYYTSCVLSGLQQANLPGLSYEFSLQNGSTLQPCILARKKDDAVSVRIICATPGDLFPDNKLLPWANNPISDGNEAANGHSSRKTPFYNSTLQAESLTLSYLSLIHKVGTELPAFRKAALLFSVWLRQRGLDTSLHTGGFGLFEAQALMAILLHSENGKEPVLKTRYDHIQLFKATLLFLTSKDFVTSPILLNAATSGTAQVKQVQTASKDLIDGKAACLFDGARNHNLFYKISPWAFARLRRQADITIRAMASNENAKFDHCFIAKVSSSMLCYDQIMDISLSKLSPINTSDLEGLDQITNISNAIHGTLKQALSDRVLGVSFSSKEASPWSPKASRSKSKKKLCLNLVVDPKQASRQQDLGPSADDKEAAASFRQFWGPKAELRRFRDGSIQETVVWKETGSENIVTQIVKYALQRHHGDDNMAAVTVIGGSFWDLVPQSKQSKTLTLFEERLKSYQQLEQAIRATKMPLTIRQISPISPGLRYTTLDIADTARSIDVIVQFESSGSWPDDLAAIQQVKIAFLQKLGDLLTQENSAFAPQVGLGQSSSIFPQPFLEVIYNTYIFNLIIYHDRELHLLKSHPSDSFEDRNLVLPEISYHNITYLRLPLHTQRVRDLCIQYPLLSQTIRLFKHWISSHLLTPHFREEVLELLVIHTFTSPAPYGTPSSLRTGFLRTLAHLAKWSWRTEPLFVSLSAENSPADEKEAHRTLQTHMEAWRKLDPGLNKVSFLVGSTLDHTGTWWTDNNQPSKMIAARLTQLAKAAYSATLQQDTDLEPETLFTSSLKDYDFILHTTGQANHLTLYVAELKKIYGEVIIWFHGNDFRVVAGLWNPAAESERWKVNLGYSSIPVADGDGDDGDKVRTNRIAMVNEIVRLGGDLISSIDLKG